MAQAALDTAALADFGGELLQDGDPGYDEARRVFNAAIDRRPALIAGCSGVADVIAALGFAREHGLPVSVRGGGHSVAGHAVVDGGVMINLRPMNRVRVDPERRVAWCGGGANWGEFDRETQAFGLAVPGGRMPDTGVGGLTLGGGSGWLERKYGFTVDSLLSAEVVTADGRLVVASADRNPDLFWALKGGGGNFGVVDRLRVPAPRGRAARLRRHAVLPDRRGRRPAQGLPRLHGRRARRDLRRRARSCAPRPRSSSPRRSAASRCWP